MHFISEAGGGRAGEPTLHSVVGSKLNSLLLLKLFRLFLSHIILLNIQTQWNMVVSKILHCVTDFDDDLWDAKFVVTNGGQFFSRLLPLFIKVDTHNDFYQEDYDLSNLDH